MLTLLSLLQVTAKAAAEAYNVPLQKAYWTPEAIAEDKDVDMVVVSVKVGSMFPQQRRIERHHFIAIMTHEKTGC